MVLADKIETLLWEVDIEEEKKLFQEPLLIVCRLPLSLEDFNGACELVIL